MRLILKNLTIVTVLCISLPAAAQAISTHVSKAALGGQEIILWASTSLDPDCSANGGAALTVLQPPQHGAVTISHEPFYPNFPPNNVRSACNRVKSPGNRALYVPAAGFKGHDLVVLQGVQKAGVVREITVDIDVR